LKGIITKDYPKKIAKMLSAISDYIESNELKTAKIKIEKQEDGNYVILGEVIVENTVTYFPIIDNTTRVR
jgi:hypothetical protein